MNSLSLIVLYIVLLISSYINITNSLFVHVFKGEKKCFHDEYYGEVVVVLRYKVLDNFAFQPENEQNKLLIEVFKEDEINTSSVIKEHVFHGIKSSGKFSYHVEEQGKFEICISSVYKQWFSKGDKIQVQFSIDTDQDEIENHEEIAKNKDFAEVDRKVNAINRRANEIANMQVSQINKEDRFSNSQIDNSNRLVSMTIFQIIIIFAVGIWQICNLRSFFKNKNDRYNLGGI